MTKELIHQLISFIDLTTLDSKDNESAVAELIAKANEGVDGTRPAAICVFPNFADFAHARTDLPIAVVAGGFPLGQTFTETKVEEVKMAASTSASEIDIVINRGKILAGDFEYLQHEIALMRGACEHEKLKVIFESGELDGITLRKAVRIAIEEGADFMKTSTGKSSVGATEEAAKIMCEEIKKWFDETGNTVGFKPSGGIRTFADAMKYHNTVEDILGDKWLTPELFRIGASSLYDNLKKDLSSI